MKQNSSNNRFLSYVKTQFNAPVYKKVLAFVNGPGGEAEAKAYLTKFHGTTFPEVDQLERQYYYRPCVYSGGTTLKCAGFGAENDNHRAFYLPEFAKGDKAQFLLPGVVVLQGYHGDKITKAYADAFAVLRAELDGDKTIITSL